MAKDWITNVKEVFISIGESLLNVIITITSVIVNLPIWLKIIVMLFFLSLAILVAVHIYKNRDDYFTDFRDLI